MKTHILMIILISHIPYSILKADNIIVIELLEDYTKQGVNTANAEQGKKLWEKTFNNKGERSCTSCHTKNLTKDGKHVKTNKHIKPMSPSVNPQRLSNKKKVKKWFKRNCKWTFGRECTPQEKANFLVYIERSPQI